MAGAPSFVWFEISEEATMEDYYSSSNINFHIVAPFGGAFLDLEVNGFYVSSGSSASLIYHVRFQSIVREDPAQTNSSFFPSVDATKVESNTLVWNVQGLQIGNSSSILRPICELASLVIDWAEEDALFVAEICPSRDASEGLGGFDFCIESCASLPPPSLKEHESRIKLELELRESRAELEIE
ncbi:uncharacterized protein G2W53_018802 [Senna tora]|uniref:Uncharacterized protein n=1 Tax=Senna tora TaxID=362788 RepID=A0A834TSK6_9FABA|nr:uncharacterized protein G2W53_018802 [Senna tora]